MMRKPVTDEDVAELTPNIMSPKARVAMQGEIKRGVQTKAMNRMKEAPVGNPVMKKFKGK